jgi:hypothetical protein
VLGYAVQPDQLLQDAHHVDTAEAMLHLDLQAPPRELIDHTEDL